MNTRPRAFYQLINKAFLDMAQTGSKLISKPSDTANLPERLEKIEKRLAAIEATLETLRKQPPKDDERRNQQLDAIYQAVTGHKPSDQP